MTTVSRYPAIPLGSLWSREAEWLMDSPVAARARSESAILGERLDQRVDRKLTLGGSGQHLDPEGLGNLRVQECPRGTSICDLRDPSFALSQPDNVLRKTGQIALVLEKRYP